MDPQNSFIEIWRDRLKNVLDNLNIVFDPKNQIEIDSLLTRIPSLSPDEWISSIFSIIQREEDNKSIAISHEIFTRCSCQYPKNLLSSIKMHFNTTKDIVSTHKLLENEFRRSIKVQKNLNDEEVDQILKRGWGVAGILYDNYIIATKIPKEFHKYFHETDPQKKRKLYCHCPIIREILQKDGQEPSKAYCYCGGGFYRGIWEEILGLPVQIEIISSILEGNNVCQFRIIPDFTK